MDHVNESENESISNEAKAAGSEGSVKRKISADIDNDAENEINTTEQSCCKRLRSGLNNDETNLIAIKTEPQDENECLPETATISSNIEPSEMGTAAVIKQEKTDESDSNMPADGPSNSTATGVSSDLPVSVKTEPTVGSVDVKAEPVANNTQLPADSTVTSTSTNLRQSCRFGVRCYRRNPAHRSAEAHPGDSDYRRPSFPAPPLGTPPCSFGNSCYRRNPVHFQQYSHPPDFDSAQNIRNRLRQRRRQQPCSTNDINTSDSEGSEDPFDADTDEEYNPKADNDNDDVDEEELEFDSQRINSDEFD